MSQESFIARQPIFDRELSVIGYELLHRDGLSEDFAGIDPDRATVELLNGSLLMSRLEDLTDGKLGFVNVPQNLLQQDFLKVLPPAQTVIEVLESVRPEPAVLEALRALKRAGYTLALDDFEDTEAYAPVVELVDIVKVDLQAQPLSDCVAVVRRHRRAGLRFLAEKIESPREYELARRAGFELFQGYFFCRPETRVRRDLPADKLNYVRFLREIARPELDLERLEELIKQELSLAAKLLRYLNSATFGLTERVSSVRQALLHLGERPVRRWGTLVALAGMGDDKPVELVRLCLVRAGFLERVAGQLGREQRALDFFLTGMFSALDALVDRPLGEALADVGLDPVVRAAIEGDDSEASHARELALACERGDMEAYGRLVARLGLSPVRAASLYAEALFWADAVFRPEADPGA